MNIPTLRSSRREIRPTERYAAAASATPGARSREPLHLSPNVSAESTPAMTKSESLMELQRLEIQRLEAEIHLASLQLELERARPEVRIQGSSSSTMSKLKIPCIEPEVFKGDIMNYPQWARSFDSLIEEATDSERDRLFYLGKYTGGVAKESIQCFLMSNDGDAYRRARSLLRRRFGDQFRIAEHYRQKLEEWPSVRNGDATGLLKLADFLDQIKESMKLIRHLSFIENPAEMRKLLKKLPYRIVEQWSRIVDQALYDEYEEEVGSYPSFASFCEFLSREARIASGPCSIQSPPSKGKTTALATASASTKSDNASQESKASQKSGSAACLLCKQPHALGVCPDFLLLTPTDRKAFVALNHLCFGCLKKGHRYSTCKNKVYSSLCSTRPNEPSEAKVNNEISEAKVNLNTSTYQKKARVVRGAAIVPVILQHESSPVQLKVYALLDSQSDSSFIAKDVLKWFALGPEDVQQVSLSLTTMNGEAKVKSAKAGGFKVSALGGGTSHDLPALYSKDLIPFNPEQIPDPDIVRQWPHLKGVANSMTPRNSVMDVGLLVGFDCPFLHLPKSVVAGQKEEPYAIESPIGWFVVGRLWPKKEDPEQCQHNRLVLRTRAKEITTNPQALEGIQVESREEEATEYGMLRTLGVQRNSSSDAFEFKLEMPQVTDSKRGILSAISSVYDPMGLIAPFMLTAKKILQQISGGGWDDPVPSEVLDQWRGWCDQLACLRLLEVPRCIKPVELGVIADYELHLFSDASFSGYGCCAYLRMTDEEGRIVVTLLMAKSRVTPLRQMTIPRLELSAAVTAVKVACFLRRELSHLDLSLHFWCDSKVVLGYIANEAKRFHVFVANRIQFIRDHSDPAQWHFVGTKSNPADLVSRGLSAKELVASKMWQQGPEFLHYQSYIIEESEPEVDPKDPEVKRFILAAQKKENILLDALSCFSEWHKMKKAVAIAIRYVRRLKNRSTPTLKEKTVSVTEMQHAEEVIFQEVHRYWFSDEMQKLQILKGNPQHRDGRAKEAKLLSKSRIRKLDPFLDSHDVIRVGGRIRRASIPEKLKHPIILPARCHVTTVIIRWFHELTRHAGTTATLNETRAHGYWILQGRKTVRSLVFHCVGCKRMRGKPFEVQMADLPEDRMTEAPPFTYCGTDLFGPFLVKEGRSMKKRWGVIFTCLSMRAVHIEVSHSLSTDSFLNAYRRFVCRRGPVRLLRCDRGTNFVGAHSELQRERGHQEIQAALLKDDVDFQFNVPLASHMGGAWERMIRSIRAPLESLLVTHGQQLDDELLHTLLLEAEAVVNSRPLTYLDASAVESDVPLTPAKLLTLKDRVVMPLPGHFVKEDIFCRKRWRRVQHLANDFWQRWQRECLSQLQARSKWFNTIDNPQVDDVVLLMDADTPRMQWLKGRVVQTIPSQDNCVRKVKVKTLNSVLERPASKLILLLRPGKIPDEEP